MRFNAGLEGKSDIYNLGTTTIRECTLSANSAGTAGGGIYIPVATGKVKAQLDLGAQYLNGGNARYLAPGGIKDLPGGHISVSPMESATHVLVVRFGARIAL